MICKSSYCYYVLLCGLLSTRKLYKRKEKENSKELVSIKFHIYLLLMTYLNQGELVTAYAFLY